MILKGDNKPLDNPLYGTESVTTTVVPIISGNKGLDNPAYKIDTAVKNHKEEHTYEHLQSQSPNTAHYELQESNKYEMVDPLPLNTNNDDYGTLYETPQDGLEKSHNGGNDSDVIIVVDGNTTPRDYEMAVLSPKMVTSPRKTAPSYYADYEDPMRSPTPNDQTILKKQQSSDDRNSSIYEIPVNESNQYDAPWKRKLN